MGVVNPLQRDYRDKIQDFYHQFKKLDICILINIIYWRIKKKFIGISE